MWGVNKHRCSQAQSTHTPKQYDGAQRRNEKLNWKENDDFAAYATDERQQYMRGNVIVIIIIVVFMDMSIGHRASGIRHRAWAHETWHYIKFNFSLYFHFCWLKLCSYNVTGGNLRSGFSNRPATMTMMMMMTTLAGTMLWNNDKTYKWTAPAERRRTKCAISAFCTVS